MDGRDSYLYYRQDVDTGTNYRSIGGGGIKEDVERLSESSANENEHYYQHTTTKVECHQESSPRSSNSEFNIKRREDSPTKHAGVPPAKKGRGRPKKICDGIEIKEWSDEEIYKLIEVWGKHDILYNCKHPLYHNKSEKSKAMETLRECLEEAGITVSTRQIFDKLTTLRNYYGAVKRKTESLKRQGFEGEEAYFCRWQFYQPLSFLEGTFSPRHSELHLKKLPYIMENVPLMPPERSMPSLLTLTNQQVRPVSRETFDRPKEPIQQNPNQMSRPIQHSHINHTSHTHLANHPNQSSHTTESSHTNQSSNHNQQSNATQVTHPNQPIHPNQVSHPNQSNHPNQSSHPTQSNHPSQVSQTSLPNQPNQASHHKYNSTTSDKTEDQLFGEMVAKMIAGIIDSEEKALLLIRIQQDIVQTKFRTKSAFQKPRVHSTSWNNNHVINPPTKESNNTHEYYAEQKTYRSLEHSPLSSRSDSPLSSPACPPKLDMTG